MFDFKETMDNLLQKEVDEGRVNGVSALVLHKGREIYYHEYGYADKEKGVPMKRDTIIRLYSMSKPITAVAVMILVERGELDLRDPISKYIKEFKYQKVWTKEGLLPSNRENTIWDLLNMTSGIPYPDPTHEPGIMMGNVLKELIERREHGEWVDTLDYAKAIATVPLCFQPGERWMYGFSADILGAIVEVVSRMKFGEFLRKELFEPLEMKDTEFFVPNGKKHRFAQNYRFDENECVLRPFSGSHLGEYFDEDVAFESGGAGLTSTIDDYSHFATMLLHKGVYKGKQIIGKKTVEFMTQNRLTKEQRITYIWDSVKGYGYGCLMRVLLDQGEAATNAPLGEFGWDGWTGNYVTIAPNDELIILYFIQRCDAGMTSTVRKIRMATYAALEEE